MVQYTNTDKIHQKVQNVPNDQKIFQHFAFRGLQSLTQIGIFGMNIQHLATLTTLTNPV
jgi:hypothetical protein